MVAAETLGMAGEQDGGGDARSARTGRARGNGRSAK